MKNKNLYAVILAGGSGTRFWPLSRQVLPKQFLKLTGSRSLLQETLARTGPIISGRNTLIVTNARLRQVILKQTKGFGIPSTNLLWEPKGKNTAPAILWAASRLYQKNKDAVMAVLPSDHLIRNAGSFRQKLSQAVRLAGQHYLVTLGIVPTRPETGYGYLKTQVVRQNGQKISKVVRFTEKPSLAKARKFFRQKNYLWNGGMFVWRCEDILSAYARHLPRMYKQVNGKKDAAVLRAWPKLKGTSVDYGILEKAKNVVTVPAGDIQWTDLGSWESLSEVLKKDGSGNILNGPIVAHNCRNTLVWGPGSGRTVAAVGLEDVIIVDTDDALLVCRKEKSQHVRAVVERFKKKGQRRFL